MLSDQREVEIEELTTSSQNVDETTNLGQGNCQEEFPMLDELDRLAKLSKYYSDGHMIKQEWLDKITLKKIEECISKEKNNSKFFFLTIEMAQIECDNVQYKVLYYEEVSFKLQINIDVNFNHSLKLRMLNVLFK